MVRLFPFMTCTTTITTTFFEAKARHWRLLVTLSSTSIHTHKHTRIHSTHTRVYTYTFTHTHIHNIHIEIRTLSSHDFPRASTDPAEDRVSILQVSFCHYTRIRLLNRIFIQYVCYTYVYKYIDNRVMSDGFFFFFLILI